MKSSFSFYPQKPDRFEECFEVTKIEMDFFLQMFWFISFKECYHPFIIVL